MGNWRVRHTRAGGASVQPGPGPDKQPEGDGDSGSKDPGPSTPIPSGGDGISRPKDPNVAERLLAIIMLVGIRVPSKWYLIRGDHTDESIPALGGAGQWIDSTVEPTKILGHDSMKIGFSTYIAQEISKIVEIGLLPGLNNPEPVAMTRGRDIGLVCRLRTVSRVIRNLSDDDLYVANFKGIILFTNVKPILQGGLPTAKKLTRDRRGFPLSPCEMHLDILIKDLSQFYVPGSEEHEGIKLKRKSSIYYREIPMIFGTDDAQLLKLDDEEDVPTDSKAVSQYSDGKVHASAYFNKNTPSYLRLTSKTNVHVYLGDVQGDVYVLLVNLKKYCYLVGRKVR
jgi:hypothetical protein